MEEDGGMRVRNIVIVKRIQDDVDDVDEEDEDKDGDGDEDKDKDRDIKFGMYDKYDKYGKNEYVVFILDKTEQNDIVENDRLYLLLLLRNC